MIDICQPLENSDKRMAIEMISVQQSLRAEEVHLRWIHGEANLADSLTKETADEPLRSFLAPPQRWRLVYDAHMRSAKARR